ncbi:MAG: FMN-binding protein [Deferrisomatales bacterium]|nr:FMN-binding protein [Deferrisomatales bacterium]
MNKRSPLYPILFMALLSAVFGTAVSTVAVVTKARVRAGEQARLRSQVLGAFQIPVPADAAAIDALWRQRVEERQAPGGPYYVARGKDGTPSGYGFPFTGPGFWGPIKGLLAVEPEGEHILGLSFTSHQETPGLGGRIAEEWFRAQFRGKTLVPPTDGGPILRFVYRKPEAEREVEAVTGATQTSSRLDRFLNQFLADLQRHPALTGAGGA